MPLVHALLAAAQAPGGAKGPCLHKADLEAVLSAPPSASLCSAISYAVAQHNAAAKSALPTGASSGLSDATLDCNVILSLLNAMEADAALQRRFVLRLLKDLNGGIATRRHTEGVAKDVLCQLELLSCGQVHNPPFLDLRIELLSVLVTLAATQAPDPSSVGFTNTDAMVDAVFWLGEMGEVLRRAQRPLRPAQHCLGILLPLLPKASPSDKKLFQSALRNAYARNASEISTGPFSLSNKIHFVCCVCVPYAVIHYAVAPVVRSGRSTHVGIAVCAIVVLLWLFSPSLKPAQASESLTEKGQRPLCTASIAAAVSEIASADKD